MQQIRLTIKVGLGHLLQLLCMSLPAASLMKTCMELLRCSKQDSIRYAC